MTDFLYPKANKIKLKDLGYFKIISEKHNKYLNYFVFKHSFDNEYIK